MREFHLEANPSLSRVPIPTPTRNADHHKSTMKKITLALISLTLIVAAFIALNPNPTQDDQSKPLVGLPWQITPLTGGLSRVFGLTLSQSTLDDARQQLGIEHDLAIIVDQQQKAGLEMYFNHFNAGPIQGKLIIGAEIEHQQLIDMSERAVNSKYVASGARKFILSAADLTQAYQLSIHNISFIPKVNLKQDMIETRFGKADKILATSEQTQHYLYPELGLDVVLNSEGKEALQYLAPKNFQQLSQPLYRALQNQKNDIESAIEAAQ